MFATIVNSVQLVVLPNKINKSKVETLASAHRKMYLSNEK